MENVNKELYFSAPARRAWIYVGRVDLNTSSQQILNYLKHKFPANNFQVEELAKREGATSVSFKVGAYVSLMEELYKGHTWPAGVLVKKFVFFVGNKEDNFEVGSQHHVDSTNRKNNIIITNQTYGACKIKSFNWRYF